MAANTPKAYSQVVEWPTGCLALPRWSDDPILRAIVVQEEGKIEKYIMRKAFDDQDDPYLPKHILYRQKEQFSDGVGYNWIDQLREKAESEVK